MYYYWLISDGEKTEIYCGEECSRVLSNGNQWTSRSCSYETEEELMMGEKILPSPCKCCGQMISANWVEEVKEQLIKKNICFNCNIWEVRSRNIQENTCIYDGEWYTIGPEDDRSSFRGFGGKPFEFLKGSKVLRSTNVWYGGKIPDIWRHKIEDNSILLKA
jgi:hypothetical protein